MVTNGRGDTFAVQMPYSKKKGTDEQLAHTRRYLEWMESRAEAEDMDETTILSSEEPFVDRLAAILTWGGRGSLTTLELDARFIEGLNQYSKPVSRHIVDSDRQQLWACASQLYRLSMTALARSGAIIPDLRIYSNTTGCSVSS